MELATQWRSATRDSGVSLRIWLGLWNGGRQLLRGGKPSTPTHGKSAETTPGHFVEKNSPSRADSHKPLHYPRPWFRRGCRCPVGEVQRKEKRPLPGPNPRRLVPFPDVTFITRFPFKIIENYLFPYLYNICWITVCLLLLNYSYYLLQIYIKNKLLLGNNYTIFLLFNY